MYLWGLRESTNGLAGSQFSKLGGVCGSPAEGLLHRDDHIGGEVGDASDCEKSERLIVDD
jgi:hypothetical protein